ncbi:HisA/HisF-related TIM barrel protein [Caballeronia telluris]|jgi:phosphoribosylformimino-5-aminoimidazole carboxamide ribotide isomerase|uniref:1-(5-phosphoribosyl)-5-[(5-phosphoribosylamino)methylideneamino] imidazole-4-carboxamide isomerase n=1 Tax=Caballeronia telluris TaxID=326475 RepID=A0A158EYW8_9BURK|nr:HisA/HisF-related TIM barrel protein [Caballeronia telluris]SAL12369.1 1-(5-phosphoribosyl)-5-[(5-phosphoribosylamino)methylideneamino] imidazole-4-carboxamide isomerase [Caballeronia telluris]
MRIIPVVDLLDGVAVHAVRGERSRYRPVQSQLCSGSDPAVVARALVDYCAAPVLYVADLDGIMRGAPQRAALARLARALPGVELWLDAGFTDGASALDTIASLRKEGAVVTPVFGSETLRAEPVHAFAHDAVLSLDRRLDAPLGDPALWHDASRWPARVIAMSLDRVGSYSGPDLATLAEIRRRAGNDRTIAGAGGVRHIDDLRAAEAAGANAWLIASALHDRSIAPSDAADL